MQILSLLWCLNVLETGNIVLKTNQFIGKVAIIKWILSGTGLFVLRFGNRTLLERIWWRRNGRLLLSQCGIIGWSEELINVGTVWCVHVLVLHLIEDAIECGLHVVHLHLQFLLGLQIVEGYQIRGSR